MNSTKKPISFLKECMADALIQLMKKKDFSDITINEIADTAGVNRSTWFRNFKTKGEAISFKFMKLWTDWAHDHGLDEETLYSFDNTAAFFRFIYEIRSFMKLILDAGQRSAIYDGFYNIMIPQFNKETEGNYSARFYFYGLYGLLGEWIKRDFKETPEEMVMIINQLLGSMA